MECKLGPLYTLGVKAEKKFGGGGANFEHFRLVVWPPQVTNKC